MWCGCVSSDTSGLCWICIFSVWGKQKRDTKWDRSENSSTPQQAFCYGPQPSALFPLHLYVCERERELATVFSLRLFSVYMDLLLLITFSAWGQEKKRRRRGRKGRRLEKNTLSALSVCSRKPACVCACERESEVKRTKPSSLLYRSRSLDTQARCEIVTVVFSNFFEAQV